MILLDTHAWLWWETAPPQLSAKAKEAIRRARQASDIGVSVVSCWELAMLVAKERIGLSLDIEVWIDRALARPGVQLLPMTPAIAVLSTRLTGMPPNDPMDRMLIATAKAHNCSLVSKDRRIRAYPHVVSVW